LSTGIPTEQAGATSVDPVPSRQPLRESRMLDQDLFAERAPALSRRDRIGRFISMCRSK